MTHSSGEAVTVGLELAAPDQSFNVAAIYGESDNDSN